MKRFGSFIFIASAIFMLALGSCKQKAEPSSTANLTQYEMSLTNDDSIRVVALIEDFFNLVENGQVDVAVSLLYHVNPNDPYGEPQPLTNEEMDEVSQVFKIFPVFGHRIDYIKFFESYLNEVKVTAIFQRAEGDIPEGTTTFYFRPVNYSGQWLLCAMNTRTGDDTALVRDEDKDSLTEKFANDKQRLDSVVRAAVKEIGINSPNDIVE